MTWNNKVKWCKDLLVVISDLDSVSELYRTTGVLYEISDGFLLLWCTMFPNFNILPFTLNTIKVACLWCVIYSFTARCNVIKTFLALITLIYRSYHTVYHLLQHRSLFFPTVDYFRRGNCRSLCCMEVFHFRCLSGAQKMNLLGNESFWLEKVNSQDWRGIMCQIVCEQSDLRWVSELCTSS